MPPELLKHEKACARPFSRGLPITLECFFAAHPRRAVGKFLLVRYFARLCAPPRAFGRKALKALAQHAHYCILCNAVPGPAATPRLKCICPLCGRAVPPPP